MGFWSSVASGIGSVFGAGASVFNNERNIRAQKRANEANIALQREMNQQNQENWEAEFDYIKHHHFQQQQAEKFQQTQRQKSGVESHYPHVGE